MAFQQSSLQERRPQPPELSINLASNNPFRRNASPVPNSASSMSPSRLTPDDKRRSTNPFLDTYNPDAPVASMATRRPESPQKSANGVSFGRPQRKTEAGVTERLVDLSLQDKPASDRHQSRRPPRHAPPAMNHRTTHSNEEKRDGKATEKSTLDIFASPYRVENKRPTRARRNSDSSMVSVKDEERRKRERERRRRERDGRDKDGKSRSGKTRRPQGMDLIDQLDVTGLYGPGMIHHDGPFDACNPHRNKNNHRAAPMSAFPVGSLNNVLGGSGPVNKGLDYDAFHGRTVQGFSDFNDTKQDDTATYDSVISHIRKNSKGQVETEEYNAKETVAPVHGEASAGLGTSTFFEGTVASKKDREREHMRRESEEQPLNPGGAGGLSRKRSIAQKIRGISKPRNFGSVTSPRSPDYIGVQSAGGRNRMYEQNPFFEDEGQAVKKGDTTTTIVPTVETPGPSTTRPRTASSPNRNHDRAPSSPPRREFYRVKTQDDDFGMPSRAEAAPTGFIGRVKSLRTKKRPDRFANVSNGGGVPVAAGSATTPTTAGGSAA